MDMTLDGFKVIVPYLTHPLVLIGYVLLLFFSIHRVLITSGIIPPLSQRGGSKVVQLLLRYGFVIALVAIVLGFGMRFVETQGEAEQAPEYTVRAEEEGIAIGGDITDSATITGDHNVVTIMRNEAPGRDKTESQSYGMKLAHFSLDHTQKCLQLIRYDPDKLDTSPPYSALILEDGSYLIQDTETFEVDGEPFLYNGQKFSSDCALEEHLSRISNKYYFTWLPRYGFLPSEVPILIDDVLCSDESLSCKALDRYPKFLITISNNNKLQAVATRASVHVKEVIRVLSAGESEQLRPIAQYVIKIADAKGEYTMDLSPPFKIAANDSASITLQILPEKISSRAQFLIASVVIEFDNDDKIETPNFMFLF